MAKKKSECIFLQAQPYNSNKWDEWMRACLDGDQASYRLLLTNLSGWLTTYFRKRLYSAEFIEDMVQETLLTLHAKRHTYNPEYPVGPWIAAIARHRLIDHIRATTGYHFEELSPDLVIEHNTEDGLTAGHDVSQLLERLPPPHAQALRLVRLEGRSVRESALLMNRSEASVKVMLHRGLKKLQSFILDKHTDGTGGTDA